MRGCALILSAVLLLFVSGCATLHPEYKLAKGKLPALAAAFSPDEQFVAAADVAGVVRVWSVESGRKIANCSGFASTVHSYCAQRLIFSPNGQTLAFSSANGDVCLWSWHDGAGEMRRLSGLPRPPAFIVFANDERIVALSGGYSYIRDATTRPTTQTTYSRDRLIVIAWSLPSGTAVRRCEDDAWGAMSCALSGDGRRVGAIGLPGMPRHFGDRPGWTPSHRAIVVLDVDSGEEFWHRDSTSEFMPTHIALSTDGAMLTTSGPSGGIRAGSAALYSLASDELTLVNLELARFSKDGRSLTSVVRTSKQNFESPFYFIGLPIPPPAKPTVRTACLDLATRKIQSREMTLDRRSNPLAWTEDGHVFIDTELNLWRLARPER